MVRGTVEADPHAAERMASGRTAEEYSRGGNGPNRRCGTGKVTIKSERIPNKFVLRVT
jgi:hypothetical protein